MRIYKIYWFIIVCDISVALLFFINISFLPPFFIFVVIKLFWALKGSGVELINYFLMFLAVPRFAS